MNWTETVTHLFYKDDYGNCLICVYLSPLCSYIVHSESKLDFIFDTGKITHTDKDQIKLFVEEKVCNWVFNNFIKE